MGLVLAAAAFLAALAGTRRSPGWGFVAVFAAGYASGVARANVLGVATTFLFDAAVVGLYLGFFAAGNDSGRVWATPTGRFLTALMLWPALLTVVPVNAFLVQAVALRATVWLLPVLLVAARLTAADLAVIARGLAGLNLAALAVGLYLYSAGVEALYPENAVTRIIYQSKDVGGSEYHRIPGPFLSAHAYGGTMLLSLPFVLGRLLVVGVPGRERGWLLAGVIAAGAGMLLCAARTPLALAGAAAALYWGLTRFSPRAGAALGAAAAGLALAAAGNERFQRAATLDDEDAIRERVRGSANENFGELLVEYPFGAGMGSAAGTSVPFFLADLAPDPVGLENEYCRILVDQGWVGLAGWAAFLGWLFARPPRAGGDRVPPGLPMMYAVAATLWLTAFLGTGLLASVPGAALMLAQMGRVARHRDPALAM